MSIPLSFLGGFLVSLSFSVVAGGHGTKLLMADEHFLCLTACEHVAARCLDVSGNRNTSYEMEPKSIYCVHSKNQAISQLI